MNDNVRQSLELVLYGVTQLKPGEELQLLSERRVGYFTGMYDTSKLQEIIHALKWVETNSVDFREILSGIMLDDVKVREYLLGLRLVLERICKIRPDGSEE